MISLEAARTAARKKYMTHVAGWAVAGLLEDSAASRPMRSPIEIPLHPPTEREALADPDRAIAWNDAWREANPACLVRARRSWPRLGRQDLPDRLRFTSPADLAEFAGTGRDWHVASTRTAAMLVVLGPSEAVVDAVRRRVRAIVNLRAADFACLLKVLQWLLDHPCSGLFIRQLPIRGVDTKWAGAHRSLVTGLFKAASGRDDLGLADAPQLVRVRFLDPGLLPIPLSDISSPIRELAALDIRPTTVFVFENLESAIAMEPTPGAVVVHGSGYAVARLGQIPWIRDARILYWGDLDSHGFKILNNIRQHCGEVRSVLMDSATLETYRDLWGREPTPATGTMSYLTEAEELALEAVRSFGDVRMEQERITWDHARRALRHAISDLPED